MSKKLKSAVIFISPALMTVVLSVELKTGFAFADYW